MSVMRTQLADGLCTSVSTFLDHFNLFAADKRGGLHLAGFLSTTLAALAMIVYNLKSEVYRDARPVQGTAVGPEATPDSAPASRSQRCAEPRADVARSGAAGVSAWNPRDSSSMSAES
eukprot:3466322-Prymnesium_polylepis.5